MQASVSKAQNITGWIITAIIGLLMLFIAVMQLLHPPNVVANSAQMGYAEHQLPIIGALLLISVLLYLIPQATVLGALLLTGFFGGAVETHIRLNQNPMALAPVVVCCLVWLGVYLREPRLRALLPIRR